jgi:hypothetical protein
MWAITHGANAAPLGVLIFIIKLCTLWAIHPGLKVIAVVWLLRRLARLCTLWAIHTGLIRRSLPAW